MSREEKVKAAVSGGYHPGGMTLVAIELAALNDLVLESMKNSDSLVAKLCAEANGEALRATVEPLTNRRCQLEDAGPQPRLRLFDFKAGDSVWVRASILSDHIDSDHEMEVEFHGHSRYIDAATEVRQ